MSANGGAKPTVYRGKVGRLRIQAISGIPTVDVQIGDEETSLQGEEIRLLRASLAAAFAVANHKS